MLACDAQVVAGKLAEAVTPSADQVGSESGRPLIGRSGPSLSAACQCVRCRRAVAGDGNDGYTDRQGRPRTVGPACDAELVVVVFDAELWKWEARRADSWTFVTLPADVSEEIRDLAGGSRRGFGSLRVRVTVGGSTWTTSIFPGSGSGNYVLPIKRPVRTVEALDVGDIATVTVELIDFD